MRRKVVISAIEAGELVDVWSAAAPALERLARSSGQPLGGLAKRVARGEARCWPVIEGESFKIIAALVTFTDTEGRAAVYAGECLHRWPGFVEFALAAHAVLAGCSIAAFVGPANLRKAYAAGGFRAELRTDGQCEFTRDMSEGADDGRRIPV